MSFKRIEKPTHWMIGDELTQSLVAIGVRLASDSKIINPNIEDTILSAVKEGLEGDYRILSLVVDWIEVHSSCLNVDRVYRVLKTEKSNRPFIAFWSGVAKWLKKDSRFKKIANLYKGPKFDLLGESSSFLIERNGEDERFKGTCFRVPGKTLRHRLDDIETPSELSKKHSDYYHRVLIGATYRADQISILKMGTELTASELARATYSSFKTAWDTKNDWGILNQA